MKGKGRTKNKNKTVREKSKRRGLNKKNKKINEARQEFTSIANITKKNVNSKGERR